MGEYTHTIDAKGRLILPAKFREELGDVFIVTKGLDNCLFVYGKKEWAILEEKLKQLQEKYIQLLQDEEMKQYFDYEIKFNVMVTDVNKIIAEAIKDVL